MGNEIERIAFSEGHHAQIWNQSVPILLLSTKLVCANNLLVANTF